MEKGFEPLFSNKGMWGYAAYFAANASYSDSYSYKMNAQKQMFYAKVLIGDSVKLNPDKNLKIPPLKDPSKSQTERYDSVQGHTGHSDVYMVYRN